MLLLLGDWLMMLMLEQVLFQFLEIISLSGWSILLLSATSLALVIP